jgi:hypothetical protein
MGKGAQEARRNATSKVIAACGLLWGLFLGGYCMEIIVNEIDPGKGKARQLQ